MTRRQKGWAIWGSYAALVALFADIPFEPRVGAVAVNFAKVLVALWGLLSIGLTPLPDRADP